MVFVLQSVRSLCLRLPNAGQTPSRFAVRFTVSICGRESGELRERASPICAVCENERNFLIFSPDGSWSIVALCSQLRSAAFVCVDCVRVCVRVSVRSAIDESAVCASVLCKATTKRLVRTVSGCFSNLQLRKSYFSKSRRTRTCVCVLVTQSVTPIARTTQSPLRVQAADKALGQLLKCAWVTRVEWHWLNSRPLVRLVLQADRAIASVSVRPAVRPAKRSFC